jgi:hypothetical protein
MRLRRLNRGREHAYSSLLRCVWNDAVHCRDAGTTSSKGCVARPFKRPCYEPLASAVCAAALIAHRVALKKPAAGTGVS